MSPGSTDPARSARLPRFERRVGWGSLLVALPAWLALGLMLGIPLTGMQSRLALWGAALLLTVLLARWQVRRVSYPLYTLSGLLEALREGDYSLRGVQGGVLGDVIYDINALAERLQHERLAFEESSHLLGKTLAALDSAVFAFDGAGRLRLVNPAGQRLLGRARDDLFGRGAEALGLGEWLAPPTLRVINHRFAGGAGRYEVRHAPLRSGGRGGQLLVINDLGRVLREEERQAWQRLLRVLGHELNNSLAPIRSMAGTLASLLARDPMPDDWRVDFQGGVELIAHRADSLGRFLASYSRLARLPAPQLRPVELGELVRKAARLEQRLALQVEQGEVLWTQADPDQLEQALINLMRNAVEAAPAGSVYVRWRREGSQAVIEVEDDGPGLPTSDNLFVPFFTTKPGGSGIGLALTRQIAEAHEGGVTLGSRAHGSGALARLWLPCTVNDQPSSSDQRA
ncbi:PAS domain-containing sensor histidine kinase [Dyella sp. C9]|uniref:sensor histidine kinase n=1 Tax=Dyella sp. C9 TaxID=2202154 RepID=UPI000DEEB4B8|nr:ATP-binding protein [Dyella sp. C9]